MNYLKKSRKKLIMFIAVMLLGIASEFAPASFSLLGSMQVEAATYYGVEVSDIQKALNNYHKNGSYIQITADGIYGNDTTGAVKNFQSRNGLFVDGICGNNTWSKLKSYITDTTSGNAAQQAINTARTYIGNIYSQPKRVDVGYKDCSSLIWFSYKSANIIFGSSTYVSTAAAEAQYGVNQGWSQVARGNLQPDDLIFYAYAGNNERYKNISHVSLYIGNGKVIESSSSKEKVVEQSSNHNSTSFVFALRPR